jgi:hypothetical protein
VQVVIVTLALTFSLTLWNLFAGGSRSVNTVTTSSQQGKSSPSYVPSASAPQSSPRIYLGGAAPQAPSFNAPAAPAPVTNTGSSRP